MIVYLFAREKKPETDHTHKKKTNQANKTARYIEKHAKNIEDGATSIFV